MCAPTSTDALSGHPRAPTFHITLLIASLYVLSGVTQPLLMELASQAGLADKSCQIYMQFYYLGTASVALLARNEEQLSWKTTVKTGAVAAIDIVAQTMNYSGATMAGPTIFAIVYSSVTIWCALLSRVFLQRKMSNMQWLSVAIVFVGLGVTGFASLDLGPEVTRGTFLVALGSALHACMYVLSEAVMNDGKEVVSAKKYCAVYGTIACSIFFLWQLYYTRYHFNELILEPMQMAGTTVGYALAVLMAIAVMSMIHSVTFFHTVKYVPGGSTSAGVLKALQAVLVFAATSLAFCNRIGGTEMCFTWDRMVSLCIVVAGVVLFGKATEIMGDDIQENTNDTGSKKGYKRIYSIGELGMEV
mmetsp:Transcript_21756/g.47283  ORF Transcript_21756/g.47283 Transcript_21756/m.47283 type:complete len:360 (-) Transcript_21756:240-1319(-)|eukprot:CAMPEP_0172313732 /NCGR_PEP_ID=MMETSP1058-20130122/20841_1 /TAXON_ID=83371 /ORGANISM="Detonula confervacea, Strain CCMP 353" /LENGTH=359 /DNA_ID=CAMNT_0013027435 /DNA_START=174 /DNA_END=1253 /DNA_ORIENTATION=+